MPVLSLPRSGNPALAALLLSSASAVTFPPSHPPTPVPSVVSLCSETTCEVLGWTNAPSYGSPTVCGETEAMTGTCPELQSWDDAKVLCQTAGARLCSSAELELDEARGTGCNYDSQLVWSATSCGADNGKSFEVAYGATLGGSANGQCVNRQNATVAAVRCCADVVGSCNFPSSYPTPLPSPLPIPAPTSLPTTLPTPLPTVKPSPLPTPEPTLDRDVDLCSAKACVDIGFTNAAVFGDELVCGESHVIPDANGEITEAGIETECADSGDYTWAEARTTCQFIGARLCT